jgi:hypothetical protein
LKTESQGSKNKLAKETKMKKRNLFISLACALVLVAIMAAPVMAVEGTETASVTINTYISATITDAGDPGINFGALNPGATNSPEAAQDGTGAINITVAAETNVACKIGIKGSGDFSDGGTNSFALGSATWDTDNLPAGATAMTTSYAQIGTDTTPGTERSQEVWHWISIPAGQTAASYTATFYYKADQTL